MPVPQGSGGANRSRQTVTERHHVKFAGESNQFAAVRDIRRAAYSGGRCEAWRPTWLRGACPTSQWCGQSRILKAASQRGGGVGNRSPAQRSPILKSSARCLPPSGGSLGHGLSLLSTYPNRPRRSAEFQQGRPVRLIRHSGPLVHREPSQAPRRTSSNHRR